MPLNATASNGSDDAKARDWVFPLLMPRISTVGAVAPQWPGSRTRRKAPFSWTDANGSDQHKVQGTGPCCGILVSKAKGSAVSPAVTLVPAFGGTLGRRKEQPSYHPVRTTTGYREQLWLPETSIPPAKPGRYRMPAVHRVGSRIGLGVLPTPEGFARRQVLSIMRLKFDLRTICSTQMKFVHLSLRKEDSRAVDCR